MNTTSLNRDDLTDSYRWHARIYDLTRWVFLFGRREIIRQAACRMTRPARILEIGCGTGRNLVELAERFPAASVTGLDLSGMRANVAKHMTATPPRRIARLEVEMIMPPGLPAAWQTGGACRRHGLRTVL